MGRLITASATSKYSRALTNSPCQETKQLNLLKSLTNKYRTFKVQKFCESLQISVKENFCDKNFAITSNFCDSMLAHPFFSEHAIYM